MFGIAVAALSSLSEEEKERYQSAYCGLCQALKQEYGQVGRTTLSYDLTFLELLYNSLYEPLQENGQMRCPTHIKKKVAYTLTPFSYYCASLSIALAYHKCLDDIADDNSIKAWVASRALKGSYKKVREEIPAHCEIIEEAMSVIRIIEKSSDASPDAASIVFGEMLAFCFECVPGHFPDLWSSDLSDLGYWLGRFIYMMDAAVDLKDDMQSGSYNPFARMDVEAADSGFMRDILGVLAGKAASAFEKMPIVENVHLLRGILYQGVWQKFNKEYGVSEQDSHANL